LLRIAGSNALFPSLHLLSGKVNSAEEVGPPKKSFPCRLRISLFNDQSVMIQRYYFHRAFRLCLPFFIKGESISIFKLPGSLAFLRAVGRPDSSLDQAAVRFQCHGGSAPGAGKGKGSRSIYRFRRGIFLMRMHPMLVQGILDNFLLDRCHVRAPCDLPIFLRGPLMADCIRTTCWVVNMNIESSST